MPQGIARMRAHPVQIRGNAYTQSALAELARVRSTELAEAGAQLKFAAADLDRMRSHASDALRHGAH